MRALVCIALLVLGACSTTGYAPTREPAAPGYANRLTFLFGQRNLDESDYTPVDEQPTFGVEYARETPGSPVGFELGMVGSYDQEDVGPFEVQGRTGELYGGVRKTFGQGVAHPYVAGGLTAITSEVEVVGIGKDDDTSLGAYVHGGVLFDVTPTFFLGLDGRFVFGTDLTIASVPTDADYGQLAVTLGFSF